MFLQFAPTYHDYVLYSNDSEAGTAPKRYRTRTFVPTGQEMESVRNGTSPQNVDTKSTVNELSSGTPRSKGQTRGGITDLAGGPLINEAEFAQSYDMTSLEPAVIPHQIVDVGLKPGEVRPAV